MVFIISILSTNDIFTQEKSDRYIAVGGKAHLGFIIKHSENLGYVKDSYPMGLELDYGLHLTGEDAWNNCNCFPKIGLQFNYWDFNNPEILGQGATLTGYVEPFFGFSNKLNVSFRFGTGLAYANSPYDSIDNPMNYSYSTRISFPLFIYSSLNYKISSQWLASISANYNHISNGGMKEPNKGINFPTMSMGLAYYPYIPEIELPEKKPWKELYPNRNKLTMTVFGTWKPVSHGESQRYPIYGGDLKLSRQASRLIAISIAAEYIDNGVLKEKINRENKSVDHVQAGMMAGLDFLMGRFIFSTQLACYIYKPYHEGYPDIYQRYSLIMRVFDGFYGGVGLKSHAHVAEFLDFRINYILNLKK